MLSLQDTGTILAAILAIALVCFALAYPSFKRLDRRFIKANEHPEAIEEIRLYVGDPTTLSCRFTDEEKMSPVAHHEQAVKFYMSFHERMGYDNPDKSLVWKKPQEA